MHFRNPRPAVENTPSLKIAVLRKSGAFNSSTWSAKFRIGDGPTYPLIVETDPADLVGFGAAAGIQFRLQGWRPLAGSRVGWWLVCPACGSRRFALFFVGGRLSCRDCAGLTYRVRQRRGTLDEYIRRAEGLKERADRLEADGHPRKAAEWRRRAERAMALHEARFVSRCGWILRLPH